VVRTVFDAYTREGLSINALPRLLNQRQIATRHGDTRWERSTVWSMLRNPGQSLLWQDRTAQTRSEAEKWA
jgi:site-specific DNA recombinase